MRFATSLPLIVTSLLAACGNSADAPPATRQNASREPQPITAISNSEAAAPATAKMAPTPGTVVRATELKDKPVAEAKTLKQLAAKTTLTVVDRQGGWLRVTAQGQQGWVRLLHVSTQPPGAAGKTSDAEAAKRIATGRAGSGNIVATSGIRGLNEEQLRTAAANPAELKKLDGYVATDAQASEYARKHGLAARRVETPAAPK